MLTIENKLIIKSACFLSDKNALQQRFLNLTKVELFYSHKESIKQPHRNPTDITSPPITLIKSGVRTNGHHSRLIFYRKYDFSLQVFTVPIVYHEVFDISKEVTKVNMKQVTSCGHHNVVIMSVTDTLHIGRI